MIRMLNHSRERAVRKLQRHELVHIKKGQYAVSGGALAGLGIGAGIGAALGRSQEGALIGAGIGGTLGQAVALPYASHLAKKSREHIDKGARRLGVGHLNHGVFSLAPTLQIRKRLRDPHPWINQMRGAMSKEVMEGTSWEAMKGLGGDIRSGIHRLRGGRKGRRHRKR